MRLDGAKSSSVASEGEWLKYFKCNRAQGGNGGNI